MAQPARMIEAKHAPPQPAPADFPFENRPAASESDDATPDPAVVRVHVHRGPAPEGPPRAGAIPAGHSVARGIGAGLQAAFREMTIQAASQGTQAVVRALLVSQAHRGDVSRWASPLAAGGVVLVAGVHLGGRAVDVMIRGRLAPDTGRARALLTSLPVVIAIGSATGLAMRGGIGSGVRLLAGIAARMAGCITGGIVAQLQDKAWGTLRLVTAQGERLPAAQVARDIDPLRVTMATCLYAMGCMCFLVLLVQHLSEQDDADPDSLAFGDLVQASRARAVSMGLMETAHAFCEALVQVAVVLHAGLAIEYVPAQPRRVLDNLLDWRGTWSRVREYAGVRVWLGSLASDLTGTLEGAFTSPATGHLFGRLAGAHAQVLMALRGWILQQPGEVAAQAQEARWQQMERAAGAAGFDVIYGNADDRLDFEPAR